MCEVKPIKSMGQELEQINMFYKDLVELEKHTTGYSEELTDLRDETTLLMSNDSGLYSKILTEHEDLKTI